MSDDISTESSDCRIIEGDCMDRMTEMDAESVHAVVTDPPYNFEGGFMGQEWDDIGTPKEYQQWCEAWASECLRVLKPGGHLIAFSSTKTYHRLATAVEDAGFEIRDQIDWLYGSGFPKGATVSQWMGDEDADRWDGFKTALKPAHEPAVLARKPLSESAVYRNVLEHGTGAFNIDRTRIPIEDKEEYENNAAGRLERHSGDRDKQVYGEYESLGNDETAVNDGRYPSNVCLDPEAAALLDRQSGECGGNTGAEGYGMTGVDYGTYGPSEAEGYDDSGGASRFYYTSKASKSERTIGGEIANDHSTVKPLALMEWLVTLVTAPGQTVLDPFAGSGTTIMACKRLGREGIGIEMSEKWTRKARRRVRHAHEVETDFQTPTEPTPAENDADDDAASTLDAFSDD